MILFEGNLSAREMRSSSWVEIETSFKGVVEIAEGFLPVEVFHEGGILRRRF